MISDGCLTGVCSPRRLVVKPQRQQPAAERGGLGRVTWHQFRHIHSSLLNDLRVPVKIAQEQLGHTSIATTLNIYTHLVDASHRAAIEAAPDAPPLTQGGAQT